MRHAESDTDEEASGIQHGARRQIDHHLNIGLNRSLGENPQNIIILLLEIIQGFQKTREEIAELRQAMRRLETTEHDPMLNERCECNIWAK